MFAPVLGDPDYRAVVLHLPMTGANNSTTFTDASASPKTITRVGDTKVLTDQSKWGQGSGYLDGSGDYLWTPSHADFSWGSGDFTVEAWVRFSSVADDSHIVSVHDSDGNHEVRLALMRGSKLTTRIYHTSAYQVDLSGSSTLTTNTWYHAALVRAGNVHTLYLNGVADGSVTVAHTLTSVNYQVAIGQVNASSPPNGYYLKGYLQDLRLTKGVARYTADFTVPSGPLSFRVPESSVQQIQQPSFHTMARLGL